MKLLHVAVDVQEEQIRAGRYLLHEHPLGASPWLDPRMTALQKTKGVFTVSSPMCCFQAKIETRDGSRNVTKFVYKPTKWVTNSTGVGGSLGSQMFEQQWATLSQTHCDGWRNSQDGFSIRTRACEHSASSTTTGVESTLRRTLRTSNCASICGACKGDAW